MKLLLLSPKPPPVGGIARWTELLLAWAARNPDVKVHHINTAVRGRRIDDPSVGSRVVGGIHQCAAVIPQVIVRMMTVHPQVLHLTTSASMGLARDLLVLALAKLFRAKSVYHLHFGRVPELAQSSGYEWGLLRWAMAWADRVLVIDRATEQVLKSVLPAGKVLFVPNPIDLSQLAQSEAIAPEPPVAHNRIAFFLGWLVPEKGLRELIRAWNELDTTGWELVIAGPGSDPFRQELNEKADHAHQVRLLDVLNRAESWEWMLKADIFVLPTHSEGFPNVVLEAMAAGKAILSTRVGAIPEMLNEDGASPCGLLVPPCDAPALKASLERLMSDGNLRADLGRGARSRVEQCYDSAVVCSRYAEVWRELPDG